MTANTLGVCTFVAITAMSIESLGMCKWARLHNVQPRTHTLFSLSNTPYSSYDSGCTSNLHIRSFGQEVNMNRSQCKRSWKSELYWFLVFRDQVLAGKQKEAARAAQQLRKRGYSIKFQSLGGRGISGC